LVTNRDIVWGLSVSGRSPNVLRAMEAARRIGAFRLGFTGRSGRQLIDICDFCFVVDDEQSDRVQEAHQLAYHLVCDQIERHYVSHP
jgi:D-sedoheptulose 7-phosphate isomerase